MTSKYTNKNGVKLLAAIAVFALVFAGAATIFTAEESDAGTEYANAISFTGNVAYGDPYGTTSNIALKNSLQVYYDKYTATYTLYGYIAEQDFSADSFQSSAFYKLWEDNTECKYGIAFNVTTTAGTTVKVGNGDASTASGTKEPCLLYINDVKDKVVDVVVGQVTYKLNISNLNTISVADLGKRDIISGATSTTISLSKDAYITDPILNPSESVTINLNGHNLLAGCRVVSMDNNVARTQNVTITAGNGGSIDGCDSIILGYSDGKLTITGGTYNSPTDYAIIWYGNTYNNNTTVGEGADLTNVKVNASVGLWFSNGAQKEVKLDNCVVETSSLSVYMATVQKATITNCTISSQNSTALEIKAGTIDIVGGSLDSGAFVKADGTIGNNGSGSGEATLNINNGYQRIADSSGNVVVSVDGTTITNTAGKPIQICAGVYDSDSGAGVTETICPGNITFTTEDPISLTDISVVQYAPMGATDERTISITTGGESKDIVTGDVSTSTDISDALGSADIIDISMTASITVSEDAPLEIDAGQAITINTSTFKFTSTIQNSDNTKNKVDLLNIKGNFTISYGSIAIAGQFDEGSMTVYGTAKLTGNVVIAPGVTFTIASDATLDLNGYTLTNNGTVKCAGSITENGGSIVNNGTFDYVGDMGLKDTINTNTEISAGAYLSGDLTIPEGVTLTIKSNGKLDMMNYNITVKGTLVIEKKGVITSTATPVSGQNSIVLEYGGVIDNKGTIGDINTVAITGGNQNGKIEMKGVSGVDIGILRTGTVQELTISGDISKTSGVTVYTLKATNVIVDEDMTIGKGVSFEIITSEVAKNVVITNEGTLSASTLTLREGSAVIANSAVNGTIGTKAGFVGDNNTIYSDKENTIAVTVDNAIATFDGKLKGVTVTVQRYNVVDGTQTYIKQGLYVSGTTSVVTSGVDGAFSITGGAFVDGTLVIGKDTSVTGAFDVSVSGLIEVTNDANASTITYTGAKYAVESKVENSTITTLYYTNFDAAMSAISTAKGTEISVSGTFTVNKSYTIAADQTIEVDTAAAVTIGSDSVITVEEDGEIANTAVTKIKGKVIVKDGGLFTPASSAYAVKKVEKETNTTTYSGLGTAIKEAKSGDVIDVVTTDKVYGSLSIPEGVTVNVKDGVTLTVTGNVTVAKGSKLTIGNGSAMVVGTSGKENTITVDGELDASKGTLTEATGSTVDLYSEGKTRILTNNNIDINSAYYNDGEKVYTCIVDAVAYAEKNGLTQVRLMGKFVDTSDVTVNGVSIFLDSGADVKLGNVTLKNAEIKHNDNTSKLTATVSGLFGTGSDAVTSAIELSESNTAVKASTTLNSSGVEVYRLAIDGVSGKNVEISEGTVAFSADSPAIAGKFIIAEGATVIIDKEIVVDGKDVEFIAFGDVIVKDGGVLELKNTTNGNGLDKTPILNGTLTLIDGSTANLYALDVIGSIVVTEQTTKSNVLNIKDSEVFVGVPLQSVAGAGSISGLVKLTDSKFIVAYAGADLSAAKINYVSGETDVVSTTYSINGIEYATVFAKEGTIDLGGSSAPITINMIKKIKGLSVSGTATTSDIVWKDAAGKNVNDKKVGDLASVDTTISLASSTIKISVGTGISLYVDDVKVIDSTLSLTVGTHTVKAIVDPMYKGDVTITFDGKTVTDGKIIVSVDSNGVVLSATGNITIDSGDTPAPAPIQPTEKDDSLGITEYLLIVLVILAAILVVVVAIRMMRS